MYVLTITPRVDSLKCDVNTVEIDGKLEDYQHLVGGYIECVNTFNRNYLMLINEEGKIDHLPPNLLATSITPLRQWDILVGTAVLVELNDQRDDWQGWDTELEAYLALECIKDDMPKE